MTVPLVNKKEVDLTNQLMTVNQVAEWLSIPVATIYAQRYRGEKPGALGFRVGRWVRFSQSDIEQWIEGQK